ncbi:MAG: DUF4433 domain-containing protein, partial [Gloeomargarita sp. SKYG116]|nr:DUF4433 domain-containing protein [Gloeomargarita sp. SKYG116]MDW8402474.1 DarT ssDNA thymidine ADP-ribosyltransferase family protein [Gloeomargarita sp. SKYGB_i_bin116]
RWVVLVLDASVLWELDCAFCRENAASRSVTQIPLNERKRFSALEAMFGDLPNCRRQELNIPDNYPTHPQAEVLVFEPIPVSYIREIHFRDKADIMEPRVNFPELLSPMACCISELYFGPRQDWPFWRNQPYSEILLDQDILDAPF